MHAHVHLPVCTYMCACAYTCACPVTCLLARVLQCNTVSVQQRWPGSPRECFSGLLSAGETESWSRPGAPWREGGAVSLLLLMPGSTCHQETEAARPVPPRASPSLWLGGGGPAGEPEVLGAISASGFIHPPPPPLPRGLGCRSPGWLSRQKPVFCFLRLFKVRPRHCLLVHSPPPPPPPAGPTGLPQPLAHLLRLGPLWSLDAGRQDGVVAGLEGGRRWLCLSSVLAQGWTQPGEAS